MAEILSNDVFICYRREPAAYLALALFQNLTERGIDVFYDFESIAAGDFATIIFGQIEARPYMVVVLTPGTLERSADPDDWVRREIEHALDLDRVLVPVHSPEFDRDDIDRYLPPPTAERLKRFNSQEVPPKFFKYAVQELAGRYLRPIRIEASRASPSAAAAGARQVARAKAAPPVSVQQLTAEEYFARALRRPDADLSGRIADLTKAIKCNPNYVEALYYRGALRAERGNYRRAISDLTKAINLNPDHVGALYYRALSRAERGKTEDAIDDFTEVINLNPNHVEAFYSRGLSRARRGDDEGAIHDLGVAIESNPEYEYDRDVRSVLEAWWRR